MKAWKNQQFPSSVNTVMWMKHDVCTCLCAFIHKSEYTSFSFTTESRRPFSSWIFHNCGGPWPLAKAQDHSRSITCINSSCRSQDKSAWVEYEWVAQMCWSMCEIVHAVNRKLAQCRMQEEDGTILFHWNKEKVHTQLTTMKH
jgi:hypothetical protein